MEEKHTPSGDQKKIEEIAARYFDLLRAGVPLARQTITAAYPELGSGLDERLREIESIVKRQGLGRRVSSVRLPPVADTKSETLDQPTTPARPPDDDEDPRVSLGPTGLESSETAAGPEALEDIGPYKILEPIGRGGMGAVYLAQQSEPVRRRVALKLIKLGLDTEEVLARFESERQALALMDHPNIARVLDAGVTELGRPYFVMEHVHGIPIGEYCDKQRLPVAARLRLFLQVCAAIQHAHHKGIIHRDIKPSNILVASSGDEPVVKIIDFGVAKATDHRLLEKSFFTQHGRIIGTPEYMSPEQAEMTSLEVDTRTDIYSLGVVLYTLLTGTLPFEPGALREGGHDELRRKIREDDPPTPSTKLTSLGDATRQIARRRQTDPDGLARLLRGDLDCITMKAMAKDRTFRYATASELAADISRHLNDEPVLARPPSLTYRLGKFVRKNRVPVLVSVGMAVVLVIGFAAVTAMYFRSERARQAQYEQRAVAEAATRAEAEQRKAAQSAQARAERETRMAKAIVEALGRVVSSVDPEGGGPRVEVAHVLAQAARNIDVALKDAPEFEASLRGQIGMAYLGLRLYKDARPQLEEAFRIREEVLPGDHPDRLASTSDWALFLQYEARYPEAERLDRQTLETARHVLGEGDRFTLKLMANLALVLAEQGRSDEAEPLARKALASQRAGWGDEDPHTPSLILALGSVLRGQGKLDEAEAAFRECVKIARQVLGKEDLYALDAILHLAELTMERGSLDEAERLASEAVEIARESLPEGHWLRAGCQSAYGEILTRLGRYKEGEALLVKAYEAFKEALRESHVETREALQRLIGLYVRWGKPEKAAAYRGLLEESETGVSRN